MTARYLPGDVLARRKGLVMHKGIALGDGMVFHNTPFGGEHVSSEREFRRGRPLRVQSLGRTERERALQAAGAATARRYNLFTNNCEHTVSRATGGAGDSPQLKAWALGIGALALAAFRHPAAAVAGYAVGRGLAKRLFGRARQASRQ